jgi:DNA-binding response OmpR family regulator
MLQDGATMCQRGIGANGEAAVRQTVLVAEDHGALRNMIANTLRNDGLRVVEATDWIGLQRRLESRRVEPESTDGAWDLIVSDICMPGFPSLDTLATLRAIPIILITALPDDQVRPVASAVDAVAVFRKPFDLDYLRAAVRAVLGRPRAR